MSRKNLLTSLSRIINMTDIIYPKTAWLTTNKSCNNRCSWCYASQSNFSDDFMDIEKLYKLVDILCKNNIKNIVFIGGEPSIYKHLLQAVKYIADKQVRMSMATNGIRFSDKSFAQQIVDSGLHNFNISLKGSTPEEYYQNTRSLGFKKSIQGYQNLKSLGANVKLSYVLGDQTETEILKLKDFLIKYSLDNIVFQLYKPSASDGKDVPDMKIIAQTCKTAFEIFKQTDLHYAFEISIPLCLFDKAFLQELIERKIIQTCCHIRKGAGIIFDSNFDILPCNHFVQSPLNREPVPFDNIIDFWNSSICMQFRDTINTYPSKKCINCNLWENCGGGCILRWFHLNPEDFIK